MVEIKRTEKWTLKLNLQSIVFDEVHYNVCIRQIYYVVFIVTDENHQWRINWQKMLVNLVSVGVIRDEHANFVKMKYEIDIYKTNPADAIKISLYQSPPRSIPECNTWTMKTQFLQLWDGYMGTYGDSAFWDKESWISFKWDGHLFKYGILNFEHRWSYKSAGCVDKWALEFNTYIYIILKNLLC